METKARSKRLKTMAPKNGLPIFQDSCGFEGYVFVGNSLSNPLARILLQLSLSENVIIL
jgi:hypothetical protein